MCDIAVHKTNITYYILNESMNLICLQVTIMTFVCYFYFIFLSSINPNFSNIDNFEYLNIKCITVHP